jgi:hypothetical protein
MKEEEEETLAESVAHLMLNVPPKAPGERDCSASANRSSAATAFWGCRMRPQGTALKRYRAFLTLVAVLLA